MLSKSGVHAIRALTLMASREGDLPIGASALAKQIGAPRNYLGKLLQKLAGEGVVRSQKGLGGGFSLARRPDRISILDVVDPIDKLSRWNGCFLGNARCSDTHPCAMHSQWSKVREVYLNMLRNTSLADVVGSSVSADLQLNRKR